MSFKDKVRTFLFFRFFKLLWIFSFRRKLHWKTSYYFPGLSVIFTIFEPKFNIPAYSWPYSGSKYYDWYVRLALTGILFSLFTVIVKLYFMRWRCWKRRQSYTSMVRAYFCCRDYMSIGAFLRYSHVLQYCMYEIGRYKTYFTCITNGLNIFAAICHRLLD